MFWLIFAPSHFLALMTIAAAILLATKFERIGQRLAAAAAVLFVVIGILPTGILLARPLENRFTRPGWPSHVDGILVLGGGLDTDVLKSRAAPAATLAEARIVSAYELARRYPNARVVFSGGSGAINGKSGDAPAAKYIFGQLGLDPSRLTLEGRSHNTWENFVFSRAIAKPRPGEVWVLATSAIHMPRSMRVAERIHWNMIPWPTDYLTADGQFLGIFEIPKNLEIMDAAVHEWIGLIAYR
ncbi:MAG: YdcF family protein [Alphaproteobacteria bacterium]|nr:YdcF family protein [Alphaproteobacteria bacterium]